MGMLEKVNKLERWRELGRCSSRRNHLELYIFTCGAGDSTSPSDSLHFEFQIYSKHHKILVNSFIWKRASRTVTEPIMNARLVPSCGAWNCLPSSTPREEALARDLSEGNRFCSAFFMLSGSTFLLFTHLESQQSLLTSSRTLFYVLFRISRVNIVSERRHFHVWDNEDRVWKQRESFVVSGVQRIASIFGLSWRRGDSISMIFLEGKLVVFSCICFKFSYVN